MLMRGSRPLLSIVVPVFEERTVAGALLTTLRSLAAKYEIVVVDGGSRDGSLEFLKKMDFAKLVRSPQGRAVQMNAGAQEATGHLLLFLHADTWIDSEAVGLAIGAMDRGADAGCFAVRLNTDHWVLRASAFFQSVRSKFLKSGTGDQAIFVRSDVFRALGGFSEDMPICEDLDFVKRFVAMRGRPRFAYIAHPVLTSARRWEHNGVGRTIALMWVIRTAYHCGVSARILSGIYTTTSTSSGL